MLEEPKTSNCVKNKEYKWNCFTYFGLSVDHKSFSGVGMMTVLGKTIPRLKINMISTFNS